MTLHDLPRLNASLNALSTVFIVMGIVAIKRDHKTLHIWSMATALVTSTAFLTSYLIYHFHHGRTDFTYPGWPRLVYIPMLISHVILAIVIVPLIIMTVIPALRARYDRHRRIAAWTWPLWLYVSVTGVLVYLMLYVWFRPV
jgi:putative membrane protein